MTRRSDRKRRDPDLGILAGQLLFALQAELFDRLADRGFADLSPRHGAVLAYLDREGSRATDLAHMSGRHKQVIGKLVDELTQLGYVERRPDPADRRAKLVVPTARGLDEMRQSDAIVRSIEARHASVHGKETYAQFKDIFREVAARQRATRGAH